MHEARAVDERIRRIDALRREGAGTPALLAELEQLVLEARAWLAADDGGQRLAPEGGSRGAGERTWKAMIAM